MDALAALPALSSFSKSQLVRFNEAADLVRMGPDEALFSEGDRLTEVNFLVAGQVAATYCSKPDNQRLTDVVLPVRPLCLPAAMLDLPAPVGMRTLSTVRLVTIPVDAVREALTEEPGNLWAFLKCALRESHQLTLDLVQLKAHSSPQRLALYLLGLVKDVGQVPARFVLPFEKRLLAAQIGCSQENLSRAFAALRRIGVQTQGASVVVRDLAALQLFAERQRGEAT